MLQIVWLPPPPPPPPSLFMIFIITQDTLYVAGRMAGIENLTLWFLIFVKITSGSVALYAVDS